MVGLEIVAADRTVGTLVGHGRGLPFVQRKKGTLEIQGRLGSRKEGTTSCEVRKGASNTAQQNGIDALLQLLFTVIWNFAMSASIGVGQY
jgi:hypothetical protein